MNPFAWAYPIIVAMFAFTIFSVGTFLDTNGDWRMALSVGSFIGVVVLIVGFCIWAFIFVANQA